jgi:DegV family protein with EDD domain
VAPVRIITDSASDLPHALAERLGIDIVSLTIRFGSEEFLDRNLAPEEFWAKCAQSATLPETSAPSPGAFQEAFERAISQGCEGIVVISLTSLLSATFSSATLAAEAVKDRIPISIIDTRAVTMSEGLLAIELAEMAQAGSSLAEIVARGHELVPELGVIATIDTLEHLIKGGRLGGAKAFLGQILSIKPILALREGVVVEAGRARTRSKALAALAQIARDAGPIRRISVIHSQCSDTQALIDLVSEIPTRFPLITADMGSTVGTHGGPGIIGVAWIREPI